MQVGAISHLPAASQEAAQSPYGWAPSRHTSARNRRMVHRLSELFAPQKWHIPEKNLTCKDDGELFFVGPAIQKRGKAHLMSSSWHTPPQPSWPHSSLDIKVKQQS